MKECPKCDMNTGDATLICSCGFEYQKEHQPTTAAHKPFTELTKGTYKRSEADDKSVEECKRGLREFTVKQNRPRKEIKISPEEQTIIRRAQDAFVDKVKPTPEGVARKIKEANEQKLIRATHHPNPQDMKDNDEK